MVTTRGQSSGGALGPLCLFVVAGPTFLLKNQESTTVVHITTYAYKNKTNPSDTLSPLDSFRFGFGTPGILE